MKIVAIIQARMGSSRLPGKILRYLLDDSVLGHVVKRTKLSSKISQIVVATTTAVMDELVVAEAGRLDVEIFRGSELDVLERYYQAARQVKAELIVRITSDCPLIDPVLIDDMIENFLSLAMTGVDLDYLSNTVTRTFPRGLDAEVFTFDALEKAYFLATSSAEREHVTPYIYRHPDIFKVKQFISDLNLSHHRWTLDTTEDWVFLKEIFEHFGRPDFSTYEVRHFLEEHPEVMSINASVEQKVMGD